MTKTKTIDFQETLFFVCDACQNISSNLNKVSFDEKCFCIDCYRDLYFECHNCNKTYKRENILHSCELDSNNYCEDCFNELVVYCEQCNEQIWSQDIRYDQETPYCEECYEEYANDNNDDDTEHQNFNSELLTTLNNTYEIIKDRRTYGIELEFDYVSKEGHKEIENKTKFGATDDGSISKKGKEYFSPVLSGDVGYTELEKFCQVAQKNKFRIKKNCGFHLHLGSKDLNYLDILKIVFLYSNIERYIYSVLPKSRRHNSMCKHIDNNYFDVFSCTNKTQKITKFLELAQTKNKMLCNYYLTDLDVKNPKLNKRIHDITTYKYNEKRYYGLNIHSHFFRKTIEIRYHSSTMEIEKLKQWIILHQNIFNYTFQYGFHDLINNISRKPQQKIMEMILEKEPETLKFYQNRQIKFKQLNEKEPYNDNDLPLNLPDLSRLEVRQEA